MRTTCGWGGVADVGGAEIKVRLSQHGNGRQPIWGFQKL